MSDGPAAGRREFTTTHWSLVGLAQSDEGSRIRARQALEDLCQIYWYPLYAFVRNRGYSSFDAQDLTQAFFARFLETGGFASVNRERGRFRTYLLGAMKHFLANEWHRARRQKRGGKITFLELDALDAESRYVLEPVQTNDPDTTFDREWARESVARAMAELRAEMARGGKGDQFEALKGSLTGAEPARAETAKRLGITEGAVKVAIHRLRQRYREVLRAEIAKTVGDSSEVEDEMRHLLATLRGA